MRGASQVFTHIVVSRTPPLNEIRPQSVSGDMH